MPKRSASELSVQKISEDATPATNEVILRMNGNDVMSFMFFRASISTLGNVETPSVFKSTKLYKVTSIPGVKVVQFESPLYFANADIFINKVQKITGIDPAKVRKKNRSLDIEIKEKEDEETQEYVPDKQTTEIDPLANFVAVHSVVLDFIPVAFMDTVGVKALRQIFSEFGSIGIQVYVSGLNSDVLDILTSTDFVSKHSNYIYVNKESAIRAATVTTELKKV